MKDLSVYLLFYRAVKFIFIYTYADFRIGNNTNVYCIYLEGPCFGDYVSNLNRVYLKKITY